MDNKLYIEQMKNYYDSLKYFNVENNKLILNYNGYYKIPLIYTNLQLLNTNLFILNPIEIFQIIYMLELLNKNNLKQNEIDFINNYTKKYLTLKNNNTIENNTDYDNRIWCLSMPVYRSYDEKYINNEGSKIIQNIIQENNKEIENGHSKEPKLVLKNPNFALIEEESNFENFKNAGFTTLMLIVSAIISTLTYIIFFMNK